MTKDEALKLALEALEDLGMKHYESTGEVLYKETFTAIKEALANEALEKMAENARELGLDYEPEQTEHGWTPERIAGMARLKEAQDKKLAQQEPVACDCDSPSWCKQYKKCNRKMLGFMPYVAQPQRTWVNATTWRGLTDGEVDKMILLMGFPPDWITENAIVKNIVRNLEAKLKAKNLL